MVANTLRNKQFFLRIILAAVVLFILYERFYCDIFDAITTKVTPRLDELKIYNYTSSNVQSSTQDLIVILTPHASMRLASRLQALDINLSDNFTTPLLIMHSDHPHQDSLKQLAKSTRRQMMFVDISMVFTLYPSDFDRCRTRPTFRTRGKWNYQQMIRFWFKILFELPLFKQYEYIMRLDDDSQIQGVWINVFEEMRKKRAVYFANDEDVDLETSLPGTMRLPYTALKYAISNNITIKQPQLVVRGFADNHILNYLNNFEVIKLEFFRRKDVWKWVEEVDRTNGIFKYRWGDAPLRYVTLAMFAEADEVLHRSHYNMPYCHRC